MKLNIAAVLLSLGLVATSSSGQARSTIDEIHIRATVQDVVLLADFSGKVIPVDFDPRFALTVRIESVGLTASNFTVGAVVAFGIHSPSLLFGEEAKRGETYDFSVQREIKHGKTKYFGLKVEKIQTTPVVPSARQSPNRNLAFPTFKRFFPSFSTARVPFPVFLTRWLPSTYARSYFY